MNQVYGFGYGLPKGVKALLIVNGALFLVTAMLPVSMTRTFDVVFGLVPALVTTRFFIWQFFTYMFIHGGFGHIFFNMFGLWMFGSELEYSWGTRDFIKFYLICGMGGGIIVWLTALIGFPGWGVPTIGASGAIFGLLMAYGMMWPDRLIFIFGIIPMRALNFVLLFGALNLFQGLTGTGGGIAVFAHVGGAFSGFIYLKYGWRIMVRLDHWWNRVRAGVTAKRRGFTVTHGSASRDGSGGGSHDDGQPHPDRDEEVNRILDKVAREGIGSLSARERRILDNASNRKQR